MKEIKRLLSRTKEETIHEDKETSLADILLIKKGSKLTTKGGGPCWFISKSNEEFNSN